MSPKDWHLEFSLAQDAEADQHLNTCVQEVVEQCLDTLDRRDCAAVILTGSLAVGEGSAVRDEQGSWHALSDLDLNVVSHAGDVPRREVAMRTLRKRFHSRHATDKRWPWVDVRWLTPADFPTETSTISTRQLSTSARVIWGDATVLDRWRRDMRPTQPMNRERALTLLMTRLAEHVEQVDGVRTTDATSRCSFYTIAKLYVDAVASWLACIDAYEPTYAARAERVVQIQQSGEYPELFASVPNLKDNVQRWTQFKLHPRVDTLGDPVRLTDLDAEDTASLTTAWQEAVAFAHPFWRWEVGRVTGASPNATTSQLIRAYLADEPLRHQLKMCGAWWQLRRATQRDPIHVAWWRAAALASPHRAVETVLAALCFLGAEQLDADVAVDPDVPIEISQVFRVPKWPRQGSQRWTCWKSWCKQALLLRQRWNTLIGVR